jgi:hypothetical protein
MFDKGWLETKVDAGEAGVIRWWVGTKVGVKPEKSR